MPTELWIQPLSMGVRSGGVVLAAWAGLEPSGYAVRAGDSTRALYI